jgi:MFS family permease
MNTLDRSVTHAAPNKKIIFIMSCLSLLSIGFAFSLRASVADDLRGLFTAIDPIRSATMVGGALGIAFMGYAIMGSVLAPFIDALGMGRLMKISAVMLIAGSIIVPFAPNYTSGNGIYWAIWLGVLIQGFAWGIIDVVTNPLLGALYPDDKVHKLNILHAWWPGGIMLGGVLGLAVGAAGMSWKIKFLLPIIPSLIFGIMCFMAKFPLTERAAAGVSFGEMFKELFVKRLLFYVFFLSMMLTAASELAPGQWVDMALTRTVGMKGIWLLIYVSGLMFVMRHFAGPIAKKLSPVGLLWVSCLLAGVGLFLLSVANSPILGFLSATVWGVGVCYMWPTMLASVNERFPKGGALGFGLVGVGGMTSIFLILPVMGKIFDNAKVAAAGGAEKFAALSGDALETVLAQASTVSFRVVAWLPLILLVVFGAIWIYDHKHGGYKPEVLETGEQSHSQK